jgi:hypothetical protein
MARKPKQTNSVFDDARREALKQFRHSVKELKKAGILSKKYDARSVKPTKYLKSVLKKFQGVLAGTEKAVKLPSRKKQQEYKDVGYKTRGAKTVIVPVDKNQTIRVNKKGDIVRKRSLKNADGDVGMYLEEVFLPIKYKNLRQWLRDAKDEDLDKLLKKNERWAFNFEGKNSLNTFPSIDMMIEYLEQYQLIQAAINEYSHEEMDEVYKHISILKTNRKVIPRSPRDPHKYKPARRRAQYERKLMRIDEMSDAQYDQYRSRELARRKAYYGKIKEKGGEQYQKIKEKAKTARRKAYAKQKETKKNQKK